MRRIFLYIKANSSARDTGYVCENLLSPLLTSGGAFKDQEVYVQVSLHERQLRRLQYGSFDIVGETSSDFVRFKFTDNGPRALTDLALLKPPNGDAWDADVGSPEAMSDFIYWALDGACLGADDIFIFWGHGGAWRGLLPINVAITRPFVKDMKKLHGNLEHIKEKDYVAKLWRGMSKGSTSTIEWPGAFGPPKRLDKSTDRQPPQQLTINDELLEKIRAANPHLKNFPPVEGLFQRWGGIEPLALPIDLNKVFGPNSVQLNGPCKQIENGVPPPGHRPGLIVFDSCLMANVECCYDLKDTGAVVLASVNFVGLSAWPIIEWLKQPPPATGQDAARAMVTLLEKQKQTRYNSASIIVTSELDKLQAALDNFCGEAIRSGNPSRTQITDARKRVIPFGKFDATDPHDYAGTVDIGEFFTYLSNSYPWPPHPTIVKVLDACKACVLDKHYFEPPYSGHGLTGLTIFFPQTCADAKQTYGYSEGLYSKGKNSAATFIQNSQWRDFLEWYWRDKCAVIP
jgi:Clostripain family